ASITDSKWQGKTGIAHTRWATHGVPSERNAHPFVSHDEISLVHNGNIENHESLRQFLQAQGYQFSSETDSEVIVHFIHYQFTQTLDFRKAVQAAIQQLEGAYALAIVSVKNPGRVIAVRHGSPLVVGKGKGENFVASDILALLPVAQEFIYLEDRDLVELSSETIQVYNAEGAKVERKVHWADGHYEIVDRGEYRHFMRKEIDEQPEVVATCMEGRVGLSKLSEATFGLALQNKLSAVKAVHLIACGTSYHAALVGKYWLEALTGLPTSVEIASEFRYRKPVVLPQTLFVTLSQSGETADTLAALRLAKKLKYLDNLAICNVPESTLTREANHVFLMRAGMEIGVASTKAFTTQLLALLLLTLALGKNQPFPPEQDTAIFSALQKLPELLKQVLACDAQLAQLAERFIAKNHALFLGRGSLYPIALEGALKLKEISYIHAEGYPGGELKHGPLALVDQTMPVIALAPKDVLFDKIKSNLSEVQARGGELYVFTDAPQEFDATKIHLIPMPSMHATVAPLAYTLPLQLLAYHVAVLKGTDVDQPRNLAKSVTVE
ncbi:MAG TPA: glutamine--fructose-6-phosphate transaminase (isomerizing), partial [Gammaproteobacteria bacterium]|nr:glutamine--fructose-6-phosphate transaminase (isomerizing) [Gammaproteobacteria bacterium]